MARVQVELWMWLGKELGKEFESPSDMRAILDTDVEDGTTVRKLFENLAGRYRPIGEKVFKDNSFSKFVVVAVNGRSLSSDKVYDVVLKDGDKVTLIPISMGG